MSKRSTAHLPKYEPQKWEYYSPGNSDPTTMSKGELIKVIRKAAKAANQRLRSLEKAVDVNERMAGAYKYVADQLSKERPRFQERPKLETDIMALRAEYRQLREFISMKTSTPTGVRAVRDARYKKAQEKGFTGTQEHWDAAVQRFFTKQAEKLYDSNTIYNAITNNTSDVLQAIIESDAADSMTKGEALVEYLRRTQP